MDWNYNMHSKLLTQTPPMTPVDLSRQKQSYQKVVRGPLLAAKSGPRTTFSCQIWSPQTTFGCQNWSPFAKFGPPLQDDGF